MYKRRVNSEIKFIAVDWGASNFRAYAVDTTGNVKQRTKAHQGVLRIRDGNYAATLKRLLGKWFNKYPSTPILMTGMIGGEHGWQEVENVLAPVTEQDLAMGVEKLFNHRFERDIYIVPGVRINRDDNVSYDEIRGEEVQVLGALQTLADPKRSYICCPGTHSKWIVTENNTLCDINTFITGELFTLLSRNGLLNNFCENNFTDLEVFNKGLELVEKNGMLLNDIYTIRNKVMTQQVNQATTSSFLSGVLIGNEVLSAKKMFPEMQEAIIVGSPWLNDMYQLACQHFDLNVQVMKSDDALIKGLSCIFDAMLVNAKQPQVNYNY